MMPTTSQPLPPRPPEDQRRFEDALRDVRKQWKRNRVAFQTKDEDVPVYPTIASQFNDPGLNWMFANLCRLLREKPPIRGLVLPGMPIGSPGMEVEGVDAPAYTVLALNRDGSTTPYAEHSP